MSLGFFIVGGILFTVYMIIMLFSVFRSTKKTRKQDYPNLGGEGTNLPYMQVNNKLLRSDYLKCIMDDDNPNCNCSIGNCFKKGW